MTRHTYRNPFRSPNWRWERTLEIVEAGGRAASRIKDQPEGRYWINIAIKFKRSLDACDGDNDLECLAEQMPEIYWAFDLYTNSSLESFRFDIEAHILARGADQEIAFEAGVTAPLIQAYEAIFFNVRGKLNNAKYITQVVLRDAVARGVTEGEYDLLWKMYGYFYGAEVLRSVITRFVSPAWCGQPDMVSSAFQDDAISTLKLKAAVAAKTVPVNSNTQIDLLNTFTKFVEIERTSDSAERAQSQILEHIEAMMTHLPFNIGGMDPSNGNESVGPLAAFRKTAVELSFEETMAVAAGQELPYANEIKNLKFPSPSESPPS